MRRVIRVVGGLLLAAAVAAPMVLANEAHEKRETVMKHFGALMKQNQTTLTSGSPDLAAVAANAAEIATTLDGLKALFPAGSAEGSDALPVIWDDWAGFEKAEVRAHDLAKALETTAKGGDAKATLAAFGALGKEGCGGCHGTYRKKQS